MRVHFLQAGVVGLGLQLHHLVQLAHQGGDVGEDGLLIVVLRLGGIGLQLVQHLDGGLVDLLMQGLQLTAQGQNGGVVGLRVAIEPLAQGASGGVRAAGELRSGIEGVAEVAGPAVVGGLRRLGPLKEGGGLRVAALNGLDAQDVGRGHKTEQQDGDKGRDRADPYGSLDAFSHTHKLCILPFWFSLGGLPGPRAVSRASRCRGKPPLQERSAEKPDTGQSIYLIIA